MLDPLGGNTIDCGGAELSVCHEIQPVVRQDHLLGSASLPQEKRSHSLYFYVTKLSLFHPPKIE